MKRRQRSQRRPLPPFHGSDHHLFIFLLPRVSPTATCLGGSAARCSIYIYKQQTFVSVQTEQLVKTFIQLFVELDAVVVVFLSVQNSQVPVSTVLPV